jgi:hypothetical protein
MEAFEFNSDNGLNEKSNVYYGIEDKFSCWVIVDWDR